MTTEPYTTDDGSFATSSDVEHRVITHANGDRTIVDFAITEENAAALSALTGDELADAIAKHRDQADREAAQKATAEATQAVLDDPPAPVQQVATTTSPLAPAPAGPDPIRQAGLDAPIPPFSSQAAPDAATVKVAEQAEPRVVQVDVAPTPVPQDQLVDPATYPVNQPTSATDVRDVSGHPALGGDPNAAPGS